MYIIEEPGVKYTAMEMVCFNILLNVPVSDSNLQSMVMWA